MAAMEASSDYSAEEFVTESFLLEKSQVYYETHTLSHIMEMMHRPLSQELSRTFSDDYFNVVTFACFRGHYTFIEYLNTAFPEALGRLTSQKRNCLHYLVLLQHMRVLKMIVERLRPAHRFLFFQVDGKNYSPIDYAIHSGLTEFLQWLVDAKIYDVNRDRDVHGKGFVEASLLAGYPESILKMKGVDWNYLGVWKGVDALIEAISAKGLHAHKENEYALVKNKIPALPKKKEKKQTVKFKERLATKEELKKILRKYKLVTEDYSKMIKEAVDKDDEEMLMLLLTTEYTDKWHKVVFATEKKGEEVTFLEYAVMKNKMNIVKKILRLEKSLLVRIYRKESTLFHTAMKDGTVGMMEYLLSFVKEKDKWIFRHGKRENVWQLGIRLGQKEKIEMLLDKGMITLHSFDFQAQTVIYEIALKQRDWLPSLFAKYDREKLLLLLPGHSFTTPLHALRRATYVTSASEAYAITSDMMSVCEKLEDKSVEFCLHKGPQDKREEYLQFRSYVDGPWMKALYPHEAEIPIVEESIPAAASSSPSSSSSSSSSSPPAVVLAALPPVSSSTTITTTSSSSSPPSFTSIETAEVWKTYKTFRAEQLMEVFSRMENPGLSRQEWKTLHWLIADAVFDYSQARKVELIEYFEALHKNNLMPIITRTLNYVQERINQASQISSIAFVPHFFTVLRILEFKRVLLPSAMLTFTLGISCQNPILRRDLIRDTVEHLAKLNRDGLTQEDRDKIAMYSISLQSSIVYQPWNIFAPRRELSAEDLGDSYPSAYTISLAKSLMFPAPSGHGTFSLLVYASLESNAINYINHLHSLAKDRIIPELITFRVKVEEVGMMALFPVLRKLLLHRLFDFRLPASDFYRTLFIINVSIYEHLFSLNIAYMSQMLAESNTRTLVPSSLVEERLILLSLYNPVRSEDSASPVPGTVPPAMDHWKYIEQ